ncbi:GIY-YIG nuclease family protein [Humidesulfovibrio sp.]
MLIYRPAHLGKWGRGGYACAMSWHVYLLTCADGALYCGVTTDVARRLAEHNAGTASRCTRARLPVRLAACAPCANKSAALRLEMAVKKRPRAAKLSFLLGHPGAACPASPCSDSARPAAARPAAAGLAAGNPASPRPDSPRPAGGPATACADVEPPASGHTACGRLASPSQPAQTPELA